MRRIELRLQPWEAARYLYATPAGGCENLGVGVDLLQKDFLGNRADDLLAHLAVLEEKKRGNVVNAKLLRQLRLGFDVYFNDLDLVRKFAGDLLEERGRSSYRGRTTRPRNQR